MASSRKHGRSFRTPLVREYEQSSGITQKAFAQSHDVRTDTFRSWLYQLRREAAADCQSAPRFVEVDTTQVHPSSQSVTLELGEVRVHPDALPEPGWLAELARQTEEARSCMRSSTTFARRSPARATSSSSSSGRCWAALRSACRR